MSWVRIDDHMADHPKIMKVGPIGFVIHIRAMCYCSRYLTDGFIPKEILHNLLTGLEHISIDTAGNELVAAGNMAGDFDWPGILIDAGLWEECQVNTQGDTQVSGWVIHDYLVYNPSKEQVIKTRENRKISGQIGGKKSAEMRLSPSTNSLGAKQILKQNSRVGQPPSPSPSPLLRDSSETSESLAGNPKKQKKQPTGDFHEAIKYFCDAHEKFFRLKYDFHGGKHGKMISKMLKTYTLQQFKAIVDTLFNTEDQFLIKRGFTIETLSGESNKLAQTSRQVNPSDRIKTITDEELENL